MIIKAENILKLDVTKLSEYKLHLASQDKKQNNPLDVCSKNWNSWVDWNQYRKNKDDFKKDYIFSLIQLYSEPNKWLFGGIFQVVQRFNDYKITTVGYKVTLVNLHKELIGRLIIDFKSGMRGRSFLLENHYSNFIVSEILETTYDGIIIP